ncbi:MAG: tetratricopeptide repeat protein, partial [Candidatus Thermoplasmatota archaeon]|nr:tetratricopeptide repeat protein [Candidatus Thermoplasmatota archaeon]
LHWADESTLFVLQYLARNMQNNPILMVGTHRPRESIALENAVARMEGEKTINKLLLGKLEKEETRLLIDGMFSPNNFPESLVERLYQQSKGNPLFVIEMLKSMQDQKSIVKEGAVHKIVSENYSVPSSVEEVVNHRLERLDMNSVAMAEYVSCIGQQFDVSVAASMPLLGDTDKTLENLLSSGILLKKGDIMEFSHALFQSIIYDGMTDRWRMGHHKSIGEHLELVHAERLDEAVYDLARHFSKTREHSKTSEYCMRAGEKAENSFAVEQALHFYKDARGAMAKMGASLKTSKTLFVTEKIADIFFLIGEHNQAMEEYSTIARAADDLETIARMHRKTAKSQYEKAQFDLCIETAKKGIELLNDDSAPETGRLFLVRGNGHWRKGEHDEALSLFRAMKELFEGMEENRNDLGHAFRGIGNIVWERGEYDEALYNYGKSREIMEEVGDTWGIAAALNNLGLVYHGMGELEACRDYIFQSLELFDRIGDKRNTGLSLNNIGEISYMLGDLDMALEYLGRSLEIRKRTGDWFSMGSTLNNIGSVYNEKGEWDKAQEQYERSLELCFDAGNRRIAIIAMCGLVDAKLEKKDFKEALEDGKKAVEMAEETGAKREQSISHISLGRAWAAVEEWDMAVEEFEKAERLSEEIGSKESHAKALYNLALVLQRTERHEQSRSVVEQALEEFSKMGMKLWAGKCLKTLGELDEANKG